jgi:hypothetical protein
VVVQEAVELTNESASGLLWWVVGAFLLAVDLIVLLAARSRRPPTYFIATVGGARTFGSTKTFGFVTSILTSTVFDTFRRISCDLCAMRKQHSLHKTVQNRLKPGVLSRTVRVPVGERQPRCTLVFPGFLPRALVAQRIEQKTSNLLAAGSTPAEGALRE